MKSGKEVVCKTIKLSCDLENKKTCKIIKKGTYVKLTQEACKWLKKATGIINFVDDVPFEETITTEFIFECFPELNKVWTLNKLKETPISEIRKEVLWHLIEKPPKKELVTEKLSNYFTARNKVYVLRDDKLSEVWIYKDGIYSPNGKTYIDEFVREVLQQGYTKYISNQVIDKISADNYINAENFFYNDKPYEIACQNGIYCFESEELLEFTPEKKHFQKVNAYYDTDAQCPNIDAFLSQICPKDEGTNIFYEIAGWCLIKNYKIEKAIMLLGEGRNGKSKYLQLLKSLLNEKNVKNISLAKFENDQFIIGELFGMLANIGADLSATPIKESGYLKELTGGDYVTASRKFLSTISFQNYAKMIFSSNELPYTYDKTKAFFDRWVLIEFPNRFLPESELNALNEKDKKNTYLQDTNLLDKITTQKELNGFFMKAIKSAYTLIKNKQFSYTKSSANIKKIWISKTDSLMGFYESEVLESYGAQISKDDFRQAYYNFCELYKIEKQSDLKIKRFLEKKGVYDRRTTGFEGNLEAFWYNIKLTSQPVSIEQHNHDLTAMFKLIEKIPKNNKKLVAQVFGDRNVELCIEKGEIYEMPSGTIKINK